MLIITKDQELKVIAAVDVAMKAKGISQNKLALSVNLPQPALSRAMKGKTALSVDTWKLICEQLGLNLDEVLADGYLIEVDEPQKADVPQEIPETPLADPVKLQKQLECWPPVVSSEKEQDCVVVKAPQEDLYRLFLFCEERMADNLRMGTRMPPIELHKLMCAMYALRDATMQLQAGEQVEPTPSVSGIAR